MRPRFVIVFASVLLCSASTAWADKVLLGVPDWNQPDNYAPLPNVGDYPNWCAPTAAADLMGYYGVFANSANFPSTPMTWQQGLWHDGTVELGWHMDTGGWSTAGGPFPPKLGNTMLVNIGPGAVNYAKAAWVDNGTNPPTTKVAAPNTSTTKDIAWNPVMWTNYVAEIDAQRPVLVSFSTWVDLTKPSNFITVDGQNVQTWAQMLPQISEGHTVCGVGYSDPTPLAPLSGDEIMVVQDNWPGTAQLVGVFPSQAIWWQNDYIAGVPEPSTFVLLGIGAMSLLGYAWRRRQTA